MVERGSRYIITTTENIYVTPSLKVLKDRNKIVFAINGIGCYDVHECSIDKVMSIFKEDYIKNDITEELIPLEENDMICV